MANVNDFKLDGTILCIDKTRPSKEGSSMMLRDLFIQSTVAGESQDIKCQLKNNNCQLLDNFLPGDEVTISFGLLGVFGGAKPKEGHTTCDTNPTGITGFSPNVNVFKVVMQEGFKRSAETLDKLKTWNNMQAKPAENGNGNGNGNPNPNPNQNAEKKDDLPF